MERKKEILRFLSKEYGVNIDLLEDIFNDYEQILECDHSCTSNCRREGCNCGCGEWHI